jgi:hypothetical protein
MEKVLYKVLLRYTSAWQQRTRSWCGIRFGRLRTESEEKEGRAGAAERGRGCKPDRLMEISAVRSVRIKPADWELDCARCCVRRQFNGFWQNLNTGQDNFKATGARTKGKYIFLFFFHATCWQFSLAFCKYAGGLPKRCGTCIWCPPSTICHCGMTGTEVESWKAPSSDEDMYHPQQHESGGWEEHFHQSHVWWEFLDSHRTCYPLVRGLLNFWRQCTVT